MGTLKPSLSTTILHFFTSFQARIGNMDGVFVAYHNTARMFGFQYVPLEEMDERLFGAKDRGWRVFEKCVGMLELIAQEIVVCFPGKVRFLHTSCYSGTYANLIDGDMSRGDFGKHKYTEDLGSAS